MKSFYRAILAGWAKLRGYEQVAITLVLVNLLGAVLVNMINQNLSLFLPSVFLFALSGMVSVGLCIKEHKVD